MVFISISVFSVVAVVEWREKTEITQYYTILYNILCFRRKIAIQQFIYIRISDKFHQIFNILCTAVSIQHTALLGLLCMRSSVSFGWIYIWAERFFAFPWSSFSTELKATKVHALLSHFTFHLYFFHFSLIQIILIWKNWTKNRFRSHFPKSECD